MQLTGAILLAVLLCNPITVFPQHSSKQIKSPQTNQKVEEKTDLISVDIKDVELKSVLEFIGGNFNVNFVDVEKLPKINVTVKVDDAPWQEILAAVLQAHSISYQLIDNKCFFSVNQSLSPDKLSSLTFNKKNKKGFGDPDFKGDVVSIDVKNVALDEVLRFLSDNYKFNFVLNQELKNKKVTVKVSDVPWDNMLSALLKTYQLGYNRIGNVVYIFPTPLLS